MIEAFGEDRWVSIARELTKQFETIKTGPLSEIQRFVESDSNQQKGEFVVWWKGSLQMYRTKLMLIQKKY